MQQPTLLTDAETLSTMAQGRSDEHRHWSYVSGVSAEPLVYETVGEALQKAASKFPQCEAISIPHQNVRWTWGELDERVDRLASAFLKLGLEIGDRLAIWSPNCAEWVLTQLATARIGVILVTINPAYRTAEFEYALKLTGCKALVLAPRFKSSDYIAMLNAVAPGFSKEQREGDAFGPGGLRHVIQIGDVASEGPKAFNDLARCSIDRDALVARSRELRPEDPINIQFTSGTSGSPKGATLTHHNILNNAACVGRLLELGGDDRLCIPVPLYHCFGMVMGVLSCVMHGACMVFPGESFDARSVLNCVDQERCTALYGVPSMFIAELEDPKFSRFDLSSLRTGIMAGAPCPSEIMRRVITDMGMRDISICYGMTETSPVSFQTRNTTAFDDRVNTVGLIHPHLEAKLVDSTGRTVPLGEIGEILVRGYSVMLGYWDDAERTRDAIDEGGWMHTGDLGQLDDNGCCRIVGRLKDMIIRGGENIYPAEVENFLYSHPNILEAAVFGVSDLRTGEAVCAWLRVQNSMTAEDVLEYCQGKIAHYKIPRTIRFVEEFPKTVTGKVQKFMMRSIMENGTI